VGVAIELTWLGQSGLRLDAGGTVVYVDPYLSDSVEHHHGAQYQRQVPVPVQPADITDADCVLITHEHLDHCDPETLPALADASPECTFLAPHEIRKTLIGFGITEDRILQPRERWLSIGPGVEVHPVPAAHPLVERDGDGCLRYLGYVIDCGGRRLYHAGDTSPHEHVIDALLELAPIHVAALPVNEFNFFRSRMGIVGNMSVREAFGLAEAIGVESVVPIHWDMFRPNSVFPEEIELVYRKSYEQAHDAAESKAPSPPFELRFAPGEL
jgi:L-ascorbate 6-phosphate lactonase